MIHLFFMLCMSMSATVFAADGAAAGLPDGALAAAGGGGAADDADDADDIVPRVALGDGDYMADEIFVRCNKVEVKIARLEQMCDMQRYIFTAMTFPVGHTIQKSVADLEEVKEDGDLFVDRAREIVQSCKMGVQRAVGIIDEETTGHVFTAEEEYGRLKRDLTRIEYRVEHCIQKRIAEDRTIDDRDVRALLNNMFALARLAREIYLDVPDIIVESIAFLDSFVNVEDPEGVESLMYNIYNPMSTGEEPGGSE